MTKIVEGEKGEGVRVVKLTLANQVDGAVSSSSVGSDSGERHAASQLLPARPSNRPSS